MNPRELQEQLLWIPRETRYRSFDSPAPIAWSWKETATTDPPEMLGGEEM